MYYILRSYLKRGKQGNTCASSGFFILSGDSSLLAVSSSKEIEKENGNVHVQMYLHV